MFTFYRIDVLWSKDKFSQSKIFYIVCGELRNEDDVEADVEGGVKRGVEHGVKGGVEGGVTGNVKGGVEGAFDEM